MEVSLADEHLNRIFEDEQISQFIIKKGLSPLYNRQEWCQGVDLYILRIGQMTSKGEIMFFAEKDGDLYVVYRKGKKLVMECLLKLSPERSRIGSWVRKVLGKEE